VVGAALNLVNGSKDADPVVLKWEIKNGLLRNAINIRRYFRYSYP
jgi:hypothetical protein